MKYLSESQVLAQVGISRATLFRWQRDGYFPMRRKLGPKRVGWSLADVEAWFASRPAVGE
ncbi:helix-turn-helix transcriptional regulator [Pseudomonas fluorescens]